MTVALENGIIVLTGDCPAGEAEELYQHLVAEPAAAIDWERLARFVVEFRRAA